MAAAYEPPQGRQVLDCGDGVCGVTALASPALTAPNFSTGRSPQIQSGDSADSVAALQDAGAPDNDSGQNVRCLVQRRRSR